MLNLFQYLLSVKLNFLIYLKANSNTRQIMKIVILNLFQYKFRMTTKIYFVIQAGFYSQFSTIDLNFTLLAAQIAIAKASAASSGWGISFKFKIALTIA